MDSRSGCAASLRSRTAATYLVLLAGCSGTTNEDSASDEDGTPDAMTTPTPTATQPSTPSALPSSFFEGVWQASGLATLECGVQLPDLATAEWESRSFFMGFEINADGTSYTGHRCVSATECDTAPSAGMTYTLRDGVWRGQAEDGWDSVGDQCFYRKYYREHWVDGETLYDLRHIDERPVEGDASDPLGCIGEITSGFECARIQATRYQRVGPYP